MIALVDYAIFIQMLRDGSCDSMQGNLINDVATVVVDGFLLIYYIC